jgi:hypothetical protein
MSCFLFCRNDFNYLSWFYLPTSRATQEGKMVSKDGSATQNKKQTGQLNRRQALSKIGLGVGVLAGISVLPEQWTKPIIGQIVLPAHAVCSPCQTPAAETTSTEPETTSNEPQPPPQNPQPTPQNPQPSVAPQPTRSSSAPAGCYIWSMEFSFSWPGGSGPSTVSIRRGTECSASQPCVVSPVVAVADSASNAKAILGSGSVVEMSGVSPALSGCSFYRAA